MDSWILIEAFVNFLQNYIIYKATGLFYDRRLSFKFSVEIVIVIMTLILTGLNYYSQIHSNPLLYFAYCLLLLVTAAIIYKGNIISKAVIIFLLIVVTGILELLAAVLITTLGGFDINTIQ
ncbi:MAG TPA: hypothetical protein PKH42_09285, partial [Sedimentibacter sp.]|nr:hypothetical protein [Sedimentibacter sp.]